MFEIFLSPVYEKDKNINLYTEDALVSIWSQGESWKVILQEITNYNISLVKYISLNLKMNQTNALVFTCAWETERSPRR